jgi:CRP/FNR family transcriptional regulator
MIGLGELQSVKILTNLGDAMLDKIKSITVVKKYKKNDYIFKEGEYAEHLYAIIAGKVALEVSISPGHPIRTKDISKNSAFGISSIADTENRTYIADARAIEDATVFCWKSSDLEKLFYQDYKMGFLFMRNVGRILKKRLESNRAQLGKELNAAQYQIA